MQKIVLFIMAVVIGSLGLVLLANQNKIATSQVVPTQSPFNFPTTPPQPTSDVLPQTENDKKTQEATEAARMATIKTTKGDITIEFYVSDAPKTVNNFVSKAKSGFYKNLTFHRVEDWVIQGGDPKGDGTGGENILTELNKKPFIAGSVGVARGPDIRISNDAQFFITKVDSPHLNGQYTNFGMVKNGMDVVQKIQIGDQIEDIIIE